MASRDLWVELKRENPGYLVLRGTYGEKVHRAFHMSRQGVRWRFWRIMNDMYVSAFETILFIERTFGTQLRDHAVQISQQRYALRQQVQQGGFQSANSLAHRRQAREETPDRPPTET